MSQLFQPVQLGAVKLANPIVMAPLTRSRANAEGVHSDLAVTYYGQRASAGLLITEATAVSKQGSGYVNIPGIWSDAQVAAWSKVTKAVHDKGGKIFMQLFHTGRVGHSSLYGEQPVSATTKPPKGQVMAADFSMVEYETPRNLKTEEIPGLIKQFVDGAANAKKAGFDGVEIHAANGYIIDQFLRDGVNERTDQYGGSLENRVRLLKEIVEGAVKIWGEGRVGVRFSPFNPFNSMSDSNPVAHYTEAAPSGSYPVAESIREVFDGSIIINGGLTRESGEKLLESGVADLVCYGAPFISNPDLVERFKSGLPLAQPDQSTFYTPGPKGYTDYPTAKQAA
jgi:N-ethylmaleimide reductase